MGKLNKVTITGFDNYTDSNKIAELVTQYPFLELGILLSKDRTNQPRFPNKNKIIELLSKLQPSSLAFIKDHLSFHLCGDIAYNMMNGILDEKYINDYYTLLSWSNRHQINVNARRIDNFNRNKLSLFYETYDKRYEVFDRKTTSIPILQYNKSNEKMISELLKTKLSFDILFDQSGGNGKLINTEYCMKQINKSYLFDQYIGFSGGINNNNVSSIIEELSDSNMIGNFWIDMESGVRTNNQLDIDKVVSVLEQSKQFIQRE